MVFVDSGGEISDILLHVLLIAGEVAAVVLGFLLVAYIVIAGKYIITWDLEIVPWTAVVSRRRRR